ncbi:MAG TPA: hypothetical protein VE401_07670 [Solirubrobacterales bacterium]|jgi:hypothetical protein|nr:hypothetical protein [Solirubrobacterales bacterium]
MIHTKLFAAIGAAALTAFIVGASVIPATAAADPPTKEEFSPAGDQIVCGETVLTITGGTVVTRQHVHELRPGLFRVVFSEVPKGVTATDEAGTVYRFKGSSSGSFTTPDPEAEGGEVGFFRFKLNITGPGGLFGTVDFRVQTKRNGEEVERDRGTCEFVEDE